MKERAILIKEIEELPDFMVVNLLGIIRYLKIGIENEFIPKSENDFYHSEEFQSIVSESIKEYRAGKTEDMDTLLPYTTRFFKKYEDIQYGKQTD